MFHDTVVAGPIVSNSKTIARFAAAEKAHVALKDSDEVLFKRLCDCKQRMVVDEVESPGADQKNEDGDDALDEEEELEVAEMLIGQGL